MHFPVVVKGRPRLAKVGFATAADMKVVSGWAKLGAASEDPAVQDAAEFAGLACKRWRFYQRAGRYAHNAEDLLRMITAMPDAEVALMFVAEAEWYKPSSQMGVCLCRRTWSNGLCVDFLTVSPEEAAPEHRSVAGVGRGLLYFAAAVAETIRASNMWGEATSLSAPAYRHMFENPRIRDFFRVSRHALRHFRTKVETRWNAMGLPVPRHHVIDVE
jgi:hypothetical protein